MGDDEVSKLQPPKLFGRSKTPKSAAPAAPVDSPAPDAVVPARPEPAAAPTARQATKPAEPTKAAKASKASEASRPAKGPRPPKEPKAAKEPRAPKAPRAPRRRLRLRRPTGLVPVALVGLVSGAVLAALTWAFVQLDAGEHLTFVYAVIVFAAAVVVGSLGLRLLTVRSPGTIAFLGTGVVTMIAICIGSGPLETVGGAIGVIVGSAPAYALSGWITVRFIDEA